jgi:hypothetical protein
MDQLCSILVVVVATLLILRAIVIGIFAHVFSLYNQNL